MFKNLLRLIAAIQFVLGLAYLFAPDLMLSSMGHSGVGPDLHYPLAMLASRFLVYGIGMWIAASDPMRNVALIRLMAAIQAVDLAAGVYFTASGVVPLNLSGFPMFNAVWIGLVSALWPIETAKEAGQPAV